MLLLPTTWILLEAEGEDIAEAVLFSGLLCTGSMIAMVRDF